MAQMTVYGAKTLKIERHVGPEHAWISITVKEKDGLEIVFDIFADTKADWPIIKRARIVTPE